MTTRRLLSQRDSDAVAVITGHLLEALDSAWAIPQIPDNWPIHVFEKPSSGDHYLSFPAGKL
jgi:hypothetical protein